MGMFLSVRNAESDKTLYLGRDPREEHLGTARGYAAVWGSPKVHYPCKAELLEGWDLVLARNQYYFIG